MDTSSEIRTAVRYLTIGTTALAAVGLMALTSCAPPPVHPVHPACPGGSDAIIVVLDDAPVRCDLTPPQRLDIMYTIVPGDPGSLNAAVAKCNHVGGVPVGPVGPTDTGLRCRSVDY